MFGLEINQGTRGWHDKAESSGRKWVLLSKIEVSRIVDFCLSFFGIGLAVSGMFRS